VNPGFQSQQGQEIFHSPETCSGAHTASYSEGSRAISLGVEQARHEATCSPPARAEIKNE